MKIQAMKKENIPDVVDIHMASFKAFFLTSLGSAFLKELYKSIIEDNSSIAIIAVDKISGIIGFVAGTTEPYEFYSKILKKRWLKFSLKALPALIAKPKKIKRLINAIFKPNDTLNTPGDCELMSIAVLPNKKHFGIGKILESEFIKIAKKKGSFIVNLTTDTDKNEDVNKFYLSCGYSLHSTYTTREGRSMNRYVKQINKKEVL